MNHIGRVIGIDVSLTSTGIASIRRGEVATPVVDTIVSKGHRGDSLDDRTMRLAQIREGVVDWIYGGAMKVPALLTVIEAPVSVRHPGGSTWDRAGLWWQIVGTARHYGPVVTVSPTTRAKWATGNGRADKAAVAAAMTRYAPQVQLDNSDEADALALAYMGAQHLGFGLACSAAQYACLRSVTWPEVD